MIRIGALAVVLAVAGVLATAWAVQAPGADVAPPVAPATVAPAAAPAAPAPAAVPVPAPAAPAPEAPKAAAPNTLTDEEKAAGFVLLFDGKTLNGWKPQDNLHFRVENGMIIADGTKKRSMMFYEGAVAKHLFTNFELRCQVFCFPGANSGVYIHTRAIESGFPDAFGYECQICNTQKDARKTGSVYKHKDVKTSLANDNEWFEYSITVVGRRVITRVNEKVAVDYTEPEGDRRLTGGTFGLQCHDPAVVQFRTIRVRVLPEEKAK
ncbi:MAG: DUF1080 domain-containing protein [Planctomycetota bacterium]|nr:DUF1080 domain-containing protein [Planctomycetota bacterium]